MRSLRQQASDAPVVLLQASEPEEMKDTCLQVDFSLVPTSPAANDFGVPAYSVVVVPLQLFRC